MDETRESPSVGPRQPWALCAAVAVAIVVGCLWFGHFWDVHVFLPAFERHQTGGSWDLVMLLGVAPYLVYALALALWGIDARHRIAGCVCAIAAGLTMWGLDEVQRHWIVGQGHFSSMTLKTFEWTYTLVAPTLLALAWGLARRRGTLWLIAMPLAPVLAGIHHELLRSTTWVAWEFRHDEWWQRGLLFVAPAILAAVAGWIVEASANMQIARPEGIELEPST